MIGPNRIPCSRTNRQHEHLVQRVQGVPGVLDHVRPGISVHDTQLHIQSDEIENARAPVPGTAQAHSFENLAPVHQGRGVHPEDTQRIVPVEV